MLELVLVLESAATFLEDEGLDVESAQGLNEVENAPGLVLFVVGQDRREVPQLPQHRVLDVRLLLVLARGLQHRCCRGEGGAAVGRVFGKRSRACVGVRVNVFMLVCLANAWHRREEWGC